MFSAKRILWMLVVLYSIAFVYAFFVDRSDTPPKGINTSETTYPTKLNKDDKRHWESRLQMQDEPDSIAYSRFSARAGQLEAMILIKSKYNTAFLK